ncbi:MAG: hypothetical protein HY093_04765 [Candidatus Liptonbacteria bacterium]|nr:hypothetical protein [Candidatus Liptonbacteria bacterium]
MKRERSIPKPLVDVKEQLEAALRQYGSWDAITRVLRNYPMFYHLSRVTVYRWLRGEGKTETRFRVLCALDILNSQPEQQKNPVKELHISRLQAVYVQLGDLRREVRNLMKDLRAVQASRESKGC